MCQIKNKTEYLLDSISEYWSHYFRNGYQKNLFEMHLMRNIVVFIVFNFCHPRGKKTMERKKYNVDTVFQLLYMSMDMRKKASCIFLDLEKIYDKVHTF